LLKPRAKVSPEPVYGSRAIGDDVYRLSLTLSVWIKA
jgi:hypothetical protein